MGRGGFALQEGQDVLAVDDTILRRGDAGQPQAGGEQVEVHAHLGAGCASRDDALPAGDERHTEAALEPQQLAPPCITRVALPPGAIVAAEEYQCLARQPEPVEGVEDLADAPIHLLDCVSVEAAFRLPAEIRRGMDGDVGHGVRQVQEEGMVFVILDELLRLAGEAAGQDILVGGGRLLHLAVAVDGVGLVVVAPQGAVERVEAAVVREVSGGMAQVPLSHQPGAVAAALQRFGEQHFVFGDAAHVVGVAPQDVHHQVHEVIGREQGVGDEGAHRVAPGEQAGARGAADRGGGVEAAQLCALGAHAPQAGQVEGGGVQVAVAQVVGQDDDDIGQLFGLRAGLDGIQVGFGALGLEIPAEVVVDGAEAKPARGQRPADGSGAFEEVAAGKVGHWRIITVGGGNCAIQINLL